MKQILGNKGNSSNFYHKCFLIYHLHRIQIEDLTKKINYITTQEQIKNAEKYRRNDGLLNGVSLNLFLYLAAFLHSNEETI